VIGDFDRPQLELSARGLRSVDEKHRELESAAAELEGPGIVYAATHATAEAAHDVLAAAGHKVTLYHAGLTPRARRDAMEAYLDGSARIVAATVAFGMGIDKPTCADRARGSDCRSTVTTRRSGVPAVTSRPPAPLYRPEDFGSAVHLTSRGVPTQTAPASPRSLRLEGAPARVAPDPRRWLPRRSWHSGREAGGEVRWTGAPRPPRGGASDAESARENEVERSRLDMMRRYAEHTVAADRSC
jgi:ATP-dependent DNA helicase RecQ